MTFKSLLNFGSSGQTPAPALDRYHSDPSDYGHYEHGWSHGGHKGKGGGGGGGAALSALTLLAFLFLINIMQQSLDNNNGTTTDISRVGEQIVAANARGDEGATKIVTDTSTLSRKYVPIKTSLQIVQNEN